SGTTLGDGADVNAMLAVAFPHDQMQVLPYNRVVKDLAGLSPDAFLDTVRRTFTVERGPATPVRRGEMAMYLESQWYTVRPITAPDQGDAIASLDVSVL